MKVITIARKPLAGSVADTCLKYGTGGLNIDACRVGLNPEADASQIRVMNRNQKSEENGWGMNQKTNSGLVEVVSQKGRWPANLILIGIPLILMEFPETGNNWRASKANGGTSIWGSGHYKKTECLSDSGSAARFFKQVKE